MLGVAIPCYKYHIPVLKRCLDSIEAQTSRPDFVVVSCSSSHPGDIPSEYSSYSFPLKIQTLPHRLNAAQNRNRAVELLLSQGCSIISFIDADDLMHPQRIEAIRFAWKQYPNTNLLLHSYNENENENRKYISFDLLPNSIVPTTDTNGVKVKENPSAKIHHAHLTVSKDIFETLDFPEDEYYVRREDSIFCKNILSIENIHTIYISNPLSIYYAEGQTHNS